MNAKGDWVEEVIGKPWGVGCHGPDRFDCYGLLYYVRTVYFGQQVPLLADRAENDMEALRQGFAGYFDGWEETDQPFNGCAVGLSKLAEPWFHHCGIWTPRDGGLVIHILGGSHVRAQSIRELKFSGYRQIRFCEYTKKP